MTDSDVTAEKSAPDSAAVAPRPSSVTVSDRNGRRLTIKKLSPLDRLRLFEALGSELSQNVPYVGYALSAACVVDLGGHHVAFPTSKRQVETLVNMLGDDGLDAVSDAYRENFSKGESGNLDTIKN